MNLLSPWIKFGQNTSYQRMLQNYINALAAAGITLGEDQVTSLTNFYQSGYTQGWLRGLKVFYFPIWEQESANSINLVNPAGPKAIFGAVDPANAQVKSAGGTMDLRFNPSSLSPTNYGCGFFLTELNAGTGVEMGCAIGSTIFSFYHFDGASSGTYNVSTGTDSSFASSVMVEQLGFASFNSTSSGRTIKNINGVGVISTLGSASAASSSLQLPNLTAHALGYNNNGTPAAMTTSRGYCCFAIWSSLSDIQCDQMSTAIYILEGELRS